MALRLFPFRQYSDHNVINMYANQTVDDNPSTDGNGSAGVIVKVLVGAGAGGVAGGSISKDVIEFASSSSYLGKTDYPFLGADKYPQTPLRVTAATTGVPVLGVTLNQTISNDENGEKLLYNPVKKDELQAVLSGQACPVATKGLFTFAAGGAPSTFSAFGNNTTTVPGNLAGIDSSTNGQMVGVTPETVDSPNTPGYRVVGHIIATGERTSQNGQADYFAGTGTAGYAMVQFDASASWQAHGN